MEKEKLSLGPTFKGFQSTLGFIVFIIGFIVTGYGFFGGFSPGLFSVGLAIVFLGVILFLAIRGVLIDHEKKMIKPYFNLLAFKIGSWESLEPYDKIILKYVNESQVMNSRAVSTEVKTRAFDIILSSDSKSDLLIKEFTDYGEAKTFLKEYSIRLNKLNVDRYEQIKQQLKIRRQQVRR